MLPALPSSRMLNAYGVSASTTAESLPTAPLSNRTDATAAGSNSKLVSRLAGQLNADTSCTSPPRYRIASTAWQPPSTNVSPPIGVSRQLLGVARSLGFQ